MLELLEQRRMLSAELLVDVNSSSLNSEFSEVTQFDGSSYVFVDGDNFEPRRLVRIDTTGPVGVADHEQPNGYVGKILSSFAAMDRQLFYRVPLGSDQYRLAVYDAETAAGHEITSAPSPAYGPWLIGNAIYFIGRPNAGNDILFRTDGTASGTEAVIELTGRITRAVAAKDRLYFSPGNAGVWVSDGSAQGTHRIEPIANFTSFSPEFIPFGSQLIVRDNDSNGGAVVYRTDGTTENTVVLSPDNSYGQGPVWDDGALYFAGGPSRNILYKITSSATSSTPVYEFNSSTVGSLRVARSSTDLILTTQSAGGGTTQFWRFDFQSNTPVLLATFATGTSIIGTSFFLNGALVATIDSGGTPAMLRFVDFTTGGVTTITTGSPRFDPNDFSLAVVGSMAYFVARDDAHGAELWQTDGTAAGTLLVRDFTTATGSSNPRYFAVAPDNKVYFQSGGKFYESESASGATAQYSLIGAPSIPALSGIAATEEFLLLRQSSNSLVLKINRQTHQYLGTFSMKFPTSGYQFNGYSLHLVGTSTSQLISQNLSNLTETELASRVDASLGAANALQRVGNRLFFISPFRSSPTTPARLGSTDGSVTGTVLVDGVLPNNGFVNATTMGATPQFFIFSTLVVSPAIAYELYRTDGTPAGTSRFWTSAVPMTPVPRRDPAANFYFTAGDGVFESDGTLTGTKQVYTFLGDPTTRRTLWATAGGIYIQDGGTLRFITTGGETALNLGAFAPVESLAFFDGTYYFWQSTATDHRLYSSDGTPAGTVLVNPDNPIVPDINSAIVFPPVGNVALLNDNFVLFPGVTDAYSEEPYIIRRDLQAPAVTSRDFAVDLASPSVSLGFSEAVFASLSESDFSIVNLTNSELLSESAYVLTTGPAFTATLAVEPQQLSDGNYRLTISRKNVTDAAGNALMEDVTQDFFFLNGDANRDRKVDTHDFNLLAANFGGLGKVFSQGNFNYDASGLVNSEDFNLFIAQYGKKLAVPSGPTVESSIVVPSPFAGSPVRNSDDDLLI